METSWEPPGASWDLPGTSWGPLGKFLGPSEEPCAPQRSRWNDGGAPKSAAPCRRAKPKHKLYPSSRGGLPPPPSSAGRCHSTDPFHGLPTDCPWIAHGHAGDCPLKPSWHSLGRLRRLLFAILGVFGGSCSLQMPFKRVLHWKFAGHLHSKCSARALRGPCNLLKPSKSTVLSSDFMVFALREGNAYSIALRQHFASTGCLVRAPVDALTPSWAVLGTSRGRLVALLGSS